MPTTRTPESVQPNQQLRHEVFKLLRQYVDIHEEVFGGSWIRTLRKLIPIPGIFLSIDYNDCASRLDPLISELETHEATAREDLRRADDRLLMTQHRYIKALLDTMRQLQLICRRLTRKTEDRQAYSSQEYANDISRYNELVSKYTMIGGALNRLLAHADRRM